MDLLQMLNRLLLFQGNICCPRASVVLNVTTLALLLEFAPDTATKSMFCILP